MSRMNDGLHFLQKELVRKLTLSPTLKFNELRIEELESEHMNYHLKQLIEHGLVVKNNEGYTLRFNSANAYKMASARKKI